MILHPLQTQQGPWPPPSHSPEDVTASRSWTYTGLESLNEKSLYLRVRGPKLLLCKFFSLSGKALTEPKPRKNCKQTHNAGGKST